MWQGVYYLLPTIVLAIIGYTISRIKKYIDHHIEHSVRHKYERELETHKANLQRDYDVQLERLRADLAERQLRSSHVYEKTADAIENIYAKLNEVKKEAIKYSHIPDSDQDEDRAFASAISRFHDYYQQKKIYLPKDTDEILDNTLASLVQMGVTNRKSEIGAERKYDELLEQLRNDFQRILGYPGGE